MSYFLMKYEIAHNNAVVSIIITNWKNYTKLYILCRIRKIADFTKLEVEVKVEAVHGKNLCQHTLTPATSEC